MIQDEKDLAILRLMFRVDLLRTQLERMLMGLPLETAIALLRETLRELSEPRQSTFPNLRPEQSDMASAELDEEILTLRYYLQTVAAKVISSKNGE